MRCVFRLGYVLLRNNRAEAVSGLLMNRYQSQSPNTVAAKVMTLM